MELIYCVVHNCCRKGWPGCRWAAPHRSNLQPQRHVTALRASASAFNSGFPGPAFGSHDADADRCAVCCEPVLLSASTPHDLPLSRSCCSLLDVAWRPLSTLSTRSTPFDPAAAWRRRCLTSPHERALCLRMARRKGWRRRARACAWWTSLRGHRDRDDGGQDAEGEGAEQHRLDFYRGFSDLHATEPSGNMWLDLTGALRHHPLDHLVHLVVHLDQADFGDAMDMVALTTEDRWLLPPLYFFQLHCQLALGLFSSRHVVRGYV